MLVPVVLVVVEGEAGLFSTPRMPAVCKKPALVLVAARLADADEAAAVPDKAPDGGRDVRVLPPDAASVGGVGVATLMRTSTPSRMEESFLISSKLMNCTSKGAPLSASMTPA